MLYCAINELDNFEFHDAEIKEIALSDNSMIWTVADINATTKNTQNGNSKDMCVALATMTFENLLIENIVFSAHTVRDSNNNVIKHVEAISANPEEYNAILTKSTDSYCFIFGMDKLLQIENERYRACFDIEGGAGNFYCIFSFSKSIVQWDEYSGEAWYEHPKWKRQSIGNH
jgi:hypothetical protein